MQVLKFEDIRALTLEILKTEFSTYFSAKQVSHEILAKKYGIPLSQIFYHIDDFKKERVSIARQVVHVLVELSEVGLVEKYSHRFWKKNGKK